ncbi:lanthionine synthetase C family protein [Phytohabitans suffuscus]|uniref:Lanthionine synthetase n=1 Tax=Phytohabitans suffuscus TaxID=624315 RepID=A0A6F8YFZ4_9ACTN|nr:lanthionine synthetase C family protein [Phytohabitans suffuscus]BCB84990.1 hypothetical protein Psuf_023030 [Phytohabitans suffuscus]
MTNLDPALRRSLARVVDDCGRRVTDRARLAAGLSAMARDTRFPDINRWEPMSMSYGDAGTALMCITLTEACSLDWSNAVGHQFLASAARGMATTAHPPLNLFGGVPGLASVVALAGRGSGYRRVLSHLDTWLHAFLVAIVDSSAPTYDLASGLVGWGAWLRLRPAERALRTAVVEALVRRLNAEPDCRALRQISDPELGLRPAPFGYIDCGMAHGVAGVVALLALYALDGHPLKANAWRALADAAQWLADGAVEVNGSPQWPRVAELDVTGSTVPGIVDRPGWCYGSPGIARAVWLAGRALGDEGYQWLAVRALRRSLEPDQVERLTTPTLCHGLAGLLLITMLFAHETGDDAFSASVDTVARALLREYDENTPFGYRDIETSGGPVDNPGFLDGAAGVVSVLAAVSSGRTPGFAKVLLLA